MQNFIQIGSGVLFLHCCVVIGKITTDNKTHRAVTRLSFLSDVKDLSEIRQTGVTPIGSPMQVR